jgi:starch-binding outer membrane protein, SusD/RagB family
MKNKLIISIAALTMVFSGCIDMNRELISTLTEEQVSTQYEFLRYQGLSLYSDLSDGLYALDNAMMASASDEAEYAYNGGAQTFNSGSWDSNNNPDDVWDVLYKAIRKVNVFLSPSDSVNLDAYKYDSSPSSQLIYKTRIAEIKNWKFEARFLRAYYYFELVKRYGGVPIITTPLDLETDFSKINRNTLSECIDFIVKECDTVSMDGALPVIYTTTENLGRVTKGAALALKSRILLYAASDLYNTPSWAGSYANPELISITGDRNAKWEAAAKAAKAVIDLDGSGYNLGASYSILGKTFDDPELIMVRRNYARNDFEYNNYPIGSVVGRGGVTPAQNLVDDYEMKDGTRFDWNNESEKAAPYSNRDPRLAMTVYYNQSKFKNAYLDISTGGVNGKGIANATTTGYYIRKFIDESLDLTLGRTSVHSWVIFRISEMYLNYAEALNEYDPGNPDISTYASKTRQRSGVNMPVIPSTLNQAEMRERIRNERRIEFAFEDHRLWDARRWMIAPEVLGAPLYGVNITATDNGYTYNKIEVEKRVFEPKMYFYPIPQRILFAKGVDWPQNPLW